MNIYDISEKAGVSIATVSRVLNNSPHVSEATRKRVLRVMSQAGYTPNVFARGLGLGSMHTIGLLCPDVSDTYQSTALSFLESSFRRSGYHCILSCTGPTADARGEAISQMRRRQVDGLVLMGSTFSDMTSASKKHLQETASVMPVLMLNASADIPGCYSVCCDDEQATRDAAEHLIRTGSRKILYLYHSDNAAGRSKLVGYMAALSEAGLAVDPRLQHLLTDRSIEGVQSFLMGLANDGIRYDAVLCSEDQLAIAAVKLALRSGVNVPDQLSVIGYNNMPVCRCIEPEISSIDNHLKEACERVADAMLKLLEHQEAPVRQLLSCSLVHRGTTIHLV